MFLLDTYTSLLLCLNICTQHQYDEKNIRRRVYDALNVLMAMDIISKDRKEIQWKGLPKTSLNDIEEIKVYQYFCLFIFLIYKVFRNLLFLISLLLI